jgi:hypothetical protein
MILFFLLDCHFLAQTHTASQPPQATHTHTHTHTPTARAHGGDDLLPRYAFIPDQSGPGPQESQPVTGGVAGYALGPCSCQALYITCGVQQCPCHCHVRSAVQPVVGQRPIALPLASSLLASASQPPPTTALRTVHCGLCLVCHAPALAVPAVLFPSKTGTTSSPLCKRNWVLNANAQFALQTPHKP